MMTWQAIETAPQDGTHVLTWNGKWTDVSWWGRKDGYSRASWRCLCQSIDHIDQPTHWQPLPDPP